MTTFWGSGSSWKRCMAPPYYTDGTKAIVYVWCPRSAQNELQAVLARETVQLGTTLVEISCLGGVAGPAPPPAGTATKRRGPRGSSSRRGIRTWECASRPTPRSCSRRAGPRGRWCAGPSDRLRTCWRPPPRHSPTSCSTRGSSLRRTRAGAAAGSISSADAARDPLGYERAYLGTRWPSKWMGHFKHHLMTSSHRSAPPRGEGHRFSTLHRCRRNRSQPDQPRALRPEPRGQGIVLRQPRGLPDPVFLEIRAGRPLYLRARGQVDDPPRALLGRQHEPLRDGEERVDPACGGTPDARGHRSRMQRVHGDAGARQAARQLSREEHVGQFGSRVGLHQLVSPLEAQVVEIQRAAIVRNRGDVDDARDRKSTR